MWCCCHSDTGGVTVVSHTDVPVIELAPLKLKSQFVMQKYAFSMDGVKSTIIPRIIELTQSYSLLFNKVGAARDNEMSYNNINQKTTDFGNHLKFLFDFFDTSYAIN